MAALPIYKICLAELKKEYNEYAENEDLVSICINVASYRSDVEIYGFIDEVKRVTVQLLEVPRPPATEASAGLRNDKVLLNAELLLKRPLWERA